MRRGGSGSTSSSSSPTGGRSQVPLTAHLARGIALALLLAVAVGALVVAWGDAPAVLHALATFPAALIAPVLLLTVWNYALRYLRWNWYLRILGVDDIDAGSSALVFLSGFAMGLTPGKSGEVTKSYWLRELAGPDRAPVPRTAPIVFAERLVDGIAMLLLAASGLAAFRFGALALLGVAAAAALAVALLQAPPVVHGLLDRLAHGKRALRATDIVRTMYDSARELLTWRRLLIAVAVGVVSWGGECLALYLVLLGLGSSPGLVVLNQATFALAAGSLVGSASLLPGGLGAAEGTVAAVLGGVAGQPREIAAAATLLIRVCTLWFGVVLGTVSLLVLARRVLGRQLTRSSTAQP